jgi:hypothetical protein
MPIFTRELLYTEINNIYELILLISEKIEDLSLKLDDFKKMLYVDKVSPCFNIKEALTAIQFKEFLEEHSTNRDSDLISETDDDDTLNKVHSILISYIEKSINLKNDIVIDRNNNLVKNELLKNTENSVVKNNNGIDNSNTISHNNSNNISNNISNITSIRNSVDNYNDVVVGIDEKIADLDLLVEQKRYKIMLSEQPSENFEFNNKEEISKLFINNDEIKNLLLNYNENSKIEPSDRESPDRESLDRESPELTPNVINKTRSDPGLKTDGGYDISNNLWLEHNDIHKPTEPKPKNTSYKNNHRRPSINNILQKFY